MVNNCLKFLLSRRYCITIAGDSIPIKGQACPSNNKNQRSSEHESASNLSDDSNEYFLGNAKEDLISEEGKESFLFIANYSSLLNPLFLDICLSKQKICYLMTKSQAGGRVFLANNNRIIIIPDANVRNSSKLIVEKEDIAEQVKSVEDEQAINPLQDQNIQNASIDCRKYSESMQNSMEKAVQAISAGEDLILWTSDELQENEHDAINNCIAFNILKHLHENNLPLPELFLARIDGIWGSSFSRYKKDNIPTLFASLFKKAHLLFLGPFLKQRPIQITFRQHKLNSADLNSMETFNNLIKNWYTANNNGALLVPSLNIYKSKRMPIMGMPASGKLSNQGNIVKAKHVKIVEKLIQNPAEHQMYSFVPEQMEQNKQSQDIPVLAEITPTIIRMPPLLAIQHTITRQGNIVDTNVASYSTRRTLLGLAKAISSALTERLATYNIGIALPMGLSSMAAFLATFDCTPKENRLPVMLDYTLDSKAIEQCIQIAGIKFVITSKALSDFVLPPDIIPIYVEDFTQAQITKGEVSSFMGFAGNTDVDAPAVMFFNKHDDNFRAFTLTHRNLMSCLDNIIQLCTSAPINASSFSLFCCLPPYTSLGLLNNIIMPLACGVPAVTVPHTHDIAQMTRIAENYNANLFIGTSSTLEQILRNALVHLPFRYAIVHTDSDMSYIYNHFPQICPDAILMQAFSVNECSSIISLNTRQQPDSIGKILPGLSYLIQNELLYVRGASVFFGYLNGEDPRTHVGESSIHQDWLCINTKVKDDDDKFLYTIE